MRESTIEKKVCDYARQKGLIVMKLSGINQKGQPDRMFLKNGQSLFIEFKAPGKLPTALQYRWLSQLRSEGFTASHCDNPESGISIIDEFIEHAS
jgi:hypothetical protein